MKKILLIISVVAFSSCKKTYYCECRLIDVSSGSSSYLGKSPIEAKSSGEANDKCNAKDEYSTSYVKDCEIY